MEWKNNLNEFWKKKQSLKNDMKSIKNCRFVPSGHLFLFKV